MKAQQASSEFLENIIPGGALEGAAEALQIYSRAYVATLQEALYDTFDAIARILGDDDFLDLSARYIASHPSKSYNLSDYGEEFSAYLRTSSGFPNALFLSELARFEWEIKNLFHAPLPKSVEKALHAESVVCFGPATRMFSSPFLVYEAWRYRKEDVACSVEKNRENLLLFKASDHRIRVEKLEVWQWSLLENLQEMPLQLALGEVASQHDLDPRDVQSFFHLLATLPMTNS